MKEIVKPKNKIVRIKKLSDDSFGGNHPNGINKGFVKIGLELKKPTIGERYHVGLDFSTSIVTKIIDKNTFKTLYSTYKITYINDEKKKFSEKI